MKSAELLSRLQQALSPAEWDALEQNRPLAPVSAFNREVLLEMRNTTAAGGGDVLEERAAGLCETLRVYLTEYMAEQPSGWKYIILASLYLAFLAGRPMHPIDLLRITVIEMDGGTIYQCPQKSAAKGTACDYCVCERSPAAP